MTGYQAIRSCGNRTFIDHGAEKSAFSPVNGTCSTRNRRFLQPTHLFDKKLAFSPVDVPVPKENGLFLRHPIKKSAFFGDGASEKSTKTGWDVGDIDDF